MILDEFYMELSGPLLYIINQSSRTFIKNVSLGSGIKAQILVITTKPWDVLGGKCLFNEHFAQK
jgi:hypothetical protein